jgi:lipopolysaccharide export system protein LptC
MSSPTDRTGTATSDRTTRAIRLATAARLFSWVAGAIGLAAIGLFLFQAGLFSALAPKEKIAKPVIEDPDTITARTSTVTGLDQQNQPYEITARHGRQDPVKANIIYLDDIGAKFRKADGKVYEVNALTGVYDDTSKEVDLKGGVVIREASSFVARMDRAHVKIESKTMASDSPVEVDMNGGGTIAAHGMQITDDGAKILFLNGVKARFGATDVVKGDQTP